MGKTKENEVLKEVKVDEAVTYTKAQFLSSKKNENVKDIVNVVVKDGEELTAKELEIRINDFLKREVK